MEHVYIKQLALPELLQDSIAASFLISWDAELVSWLSKQIIRLYERYGVT